MGRAVQVTRLLRTLVFGLEKRGEAALYNGWKSEGYQGLQSTANEWIKTHPRLLPFFLLFI